MISPNEKSAISMADKNYPPAKGGKMAKAKMVTAVEGEKPKEEIFYMMNMPEWFIESNENRRIEIVETLLGHDAPKPDEEFSKKELERLVNSL